MTSTTAENPAIAAQAEAQPTVQDAVAQEARNGLLAQPRTLSPWLFYDERGSALFEQITELPEYYLTRTERSIFTAHADAILEAGAGTASKTGILLSAAVRRQGSVLYQPVDVSPSALDEAAANIEANIPGVTIQPQVANYTLEPLTLSRPHAAPGSRPTSASAEARVLALYIGSSIGNFSPAESRDLLQNLRAQLRPGDSLLLGTDLAPSPEAGARKSVQTLLSAYDDLAGTTADFNRNILHRLNRDLGSDFDTHCFVHRASWNPAQSRIEMHLESLTRQVIHIPANSAGPAISFELLGGETIHTENSYKFTTGSIAALLSSAGFTIARTWHDPDDLFAVTLAVAS